MDDDTDAEIIRQLNDETITDVVLCSRNMWLAIIYNKLDKLYCLQYNMDGIINTLLNNESIYGVGKDNGEYVYTITYDIGNSKKRRSYIHNTICDRNFYRLLSLLELNDWTHPTIEHWTQCNETLLK